MEEVVWWWSCLSLSFIVGALGSLALGYFLRLTKPPPPPIAADATVEINDTKKKTKMMTTKNPSRPPLEIEKLAAILEDFKMVLVVRNDLKMGKGKIAAQCSHAALGLYKKLHNRAPKALDRWENCGQVKVVLKIDSEDDLLDLQARAKSLNLSTHITIDAGRTQIAPNSRTVMAILGGCCCLAWDVDTYVALRKGTVTLAASMEKQDAVCYVELDKKATFC